MRFKILKCLKLNFTSVTWGRKGPTFNCKKKIVQKFDGRRQFPQ